MATCIRYVGHVQGVGFRHTTNTIARGFDVRGYVRNLPDGRVELLVEGPAQVVADFLDAVRARWADHIRDTEESDVAAAPFTSFSIRY